jgi:hypothetical protein
MGLGNRFAHEVDQRAVDTGVCHATGREKKFQDAAPCRLNESRKGFSSLSYDDVSVHRAAQSMKCSIDG